MRLRPNMDLHNDLCVAVEQAMWDAGLIDPDDRTVAFPGADGIPKWDVPDAVIGAVAARCAAVFATYGAARDERWRMKKDGARLPPKPIR